MDIFFYISTALALVLVCIVIFVCKAMQRKPSKPETDPSALLYVLSKQIHGLKAEINKVHERITLCNKRTAHVEHYTGLRSHSFEPGERMWTFHQIAKDLSANEAIRPVSTHQKRRQVA